MGYNKGYYLADGIYSRWSTFVNTIPNPVPGGKNSHFAKVQEACRKDVERAFGVLQSRFAVVWFPAQTWSKDQGTIAFLPLVGSYPRVLPLLFELAQFCPYFFRRGPSNAL